MKKSLTIVCLGDSLTAGNPGFSGYGTWSGNAESQYEYWLEKRIKDTYLEEEKDIEVEIINFGVGGNTLWQMQYRFRKDVLRLVPDPDYVIVMGGINDLLGHGSHPVGITKDLSELYDTIMDVKAQVIPMEIAPCTVTRRYVERIQECNQEIHKLAKLMEVPYVPIFDALKSENGFELKKEYDFGDGVHYNVTGYQKIGDTIFNTVVKQILEE